MPRADREPTRRERKARGERQAQDTRHRDLAGLEAARARGGGRGLELELVLSISFIHCAVLR